MGAPSTILAFALNEFAEDAIDHELASGNNRRSRTIEADFEKERNLILEAEKDQKANILSDFNALLSRERARFASSGLSTKTSSFEAFTNDLKKREEEELAKAQQKTADYLSKLEKAKNTRLSQSQASGKNLLRKLTGDPFEPYRKLGKLFSGEDKR